MAPAARVQRPLAEHSARVGLTKGWVGSCLSSHTLLPPRHCPEGSNPLHRQERSTGYPKTPRPRPARGLRGGPGSGTLGAAAAPAHALTRGCGFFRALEVPEAKKAATRARSPGTGSGGTPAGAWAGEPEGWRWPQGGRGTRGLRSPFERRPGAGMGRRSRHQRRDRKLRMEPGQGDASAQGSRVSGTWCGRRPGRILSGGSHASAPAVRIRPALWTALLSNQQPHTDRGGRNQSWMASKEWGGGLKCLVVQRLFEVVGFTGS